MSYADPDDYWHELREEERSEAARLPEEPREGSLEWAIERGYEQAEEGTY